MNDYVLFDKANQHIVTDSQGQIIFYADKNEAINDCYGNEMVIGFIELAHDKYGQEVEEFARKCDITGEGMNEGWCWGDGSFYTKYEMDTLVECSRDRDSIIEHWNASETNDLNDMIGEDNVKVLQGLLERDELTSTDLLEMGYASDYLYYTEWEDEDDYQYVMINGILVEKE